MARAAFFAFASAATVVGCASAQLGPFPLDPVAQAALEFAASVPLQRPTGLGRADYLDWVAGIVNHFAPMQDASGRIIDPYEHEEIQYATPCFGMACFVLAADNFTATSVPRPPASACAAALNSSIIELESSVCASDSCNFFMKPVMLGYRVAKEHGLVSASTLAAWDDRLRRIDPYTAFHHFQTDNWGLVAAGGEFLRDKAGLNTNASWYQREVAMQVARPGTFTANGQYEDHTGFEGLNPVPYDLFARSYLTVMEVEGFAGPEAAFLNETGRRGGLLSLLTQSPKGEIPTGGRSSQHQWNEAVAVMLLEIRSAIHAARAGGAAMSPRPAAGSDAHLACVYKRAARLSLESARRWVDRSAGGGNVSVVKNWFDPALRFGWEGYSFESQYNLMPAAMVAAATLYMNDAVPECSAPADVGGFAFLDPELHKIIANAGGAFAELETAADPHYDSTGLQRFHVAAPARDQLLGPTAGPAWKDGAIAVGPQWTMRPGCDADVPAADSLANMTVNDVGAVSLDPGLVVGPGTVPFTATYALPGRGITVILDVVLAAAGNASAALPPPPPGFRDAGTVVVTATVERQRPCADGGLPFASVGAEFPALVFDGRANSTVDASAPASGVTLLPASPTPPGGTVFFALPVSDDLAWDWAVSEPVHKSRNGIMRRITASIQPATARPSFAFGARAIVAA